MVLDAQALENLEILEVQGKTKMITEGSLLHHLDRCSTKFGRRLFKKWLCSPLFSEEKLQARIDAVEELVNNYSFVEKFKLKMRKFADLERYLCRIYKYSISTQSNAIYVDVNSLSRLDELFLLLTQLIEIIDVLDEVFSDRSGLSSKRLKALVTFESQSYAEGFGKKKTRKKAVKKTKKKTKKVEESKEGQFTLESDEEDKQGEEYKERSRNRNEGDGILPDIREHLNQFQKVITWKKINNKNVPEPVKGLSKEFDDANNEVNNIKKSIQECLLKARKEMSLPDMKFNTGSKRYRFEFDLLNKYTKDVPENYIETSKSKKYTRYQTQELGDLVDQLQEAEENLKDAISPFLSRLFRKFYKKQYLWTDFISCIAEVDCIMSLAEVSKVEDDMVKPIIVPRKDVHQKACIEIIGVRHPCVQKVVDQFVPNDV